MQRLQDKDCIFKVFLCINFHVKKMFFSNWIADKFTKMERGRGRGYYIETRSKKSLIKYWKIIFFRTLHITKMLYLKRCHETVTKLLIFCIYLKRRSFSISLVIIPCIRLSQTDCSYR